MAIQAALDANTSPLNLAAIQGDVLLGLQKDAELFFFFAIADAAGFKARLPGLAAIVTSSAKVTEREGVIRRAKATGSGERLDFLGVNIGFTAPGLAKLLGQALPGGAGLDPSFLAGALDRADELGDETGDWLPPFTADTIDGVLLFTGPDAAAVDAHAQSVLQGLGGTIAGVYSEMGKTRPQRGHEHFGFLDGVSQPGIRGLTPPQNPTDPNQGLPGQDLIHPGEFVFGYPGQAPDDKDVPGPVAAPPLPWMQDGSYMVFRRLEQKVLGFRAFVESAANRIGIDEGLLAARLVGRWPSGAPLVLAPLQDDFGLGADPRANNDFEYQDQDAFQRRCPYAAHIRKTYPRDDLNDAGGIPALAGERGEASVQTRRLRRAGIPFGDEVGADENVGAERSRGLMFVCYQTSIEDQFEFVQKDWANSDTFVFGKQRPDGSGPVTPGHDPLIGQVAGDQRTMDEPVPNYPLGNTRSTLDIDERFVQATGAGYFFVPSIDALKSAPLA